MTNSAQVELDKLRAALAGLEAQRALLGDAIVEPAMAALRHTLAELEVQQRAAHVEERRILTILFTDIVGSTAMGEKLDPEDWRELLGSILATAEHQVRQHDGTVLQYQGDGLLALFGAETADERDPENAIRAGLAIQAALRVASPPGGTSTRPTVQMRVGIHTGLVVLGDIGSEEKREFTALGDAMNVASRLQSAAPPGGVLISHDTFRHVRGVFVVAPQPPLTVKGKVEPIQTYLVSGAKPRPFRATSRGVAGVEARTVGREDEQRQLQQAVADALEHRALVWAQLVGEPGVGKTRLLGDTADYLELRPEVLRLLRGRAFQGDERQPFALVRRMWFDRFEIAEDAPLADAEARWMEAFGAFRGSPSEEAAQALGLLVGLSFTGSSHIRALRDDPAQLKGRAYVVSRELLAAMRAQTPVAVLLEDLQWADASSRDYLMQVLLEGAPSRDGASLHGIFVLGTARPEWEPHDVLLKSPAYREIVLRPLGDDDARTLTTALLRHGQDAPQEVPEDVVSMIVERSEGVPYFVEEMINWFLDRGIIDAGATPWHFNPIRLSESPLPATLQHLLLTRLGALHDAERMALQRGSVFGRRFWEGGLVALGVPAAAGVLAPLQPRGFVDLQPESTFAGDVEWGFHHNLFHQVTYESVLRRERRALHKAAGAWLEAQAGKAGRLDEFVGIIGDHAERAGELVVAADWYQRAGDHAKARGALVEARRYYECVLTLVPADDRPRRWQALLGQSDVLYMLGDTAACRAAVTSLMDVSHGLDEQHQAEALYLEGFNRDSTGDYRGALQTYESALALARAASDKVLEARLLALMAISQNRLGQGEVSAATAHAALACIEQVGEEMAIKALVNVAVYFVEAGDIAQALLLHRKQAAVTGHLGDRSGRANALANLGYDYIGLGLFGEGRVALEESIQLCRAVGIRRELAYSQLNLALAHWRSGDHRAARQVLESVNDELAAMGDSFARAAGLSYTALALEQSGDPAAALSRFGEARDILESLGVRGYAVDALAGMARCELALGHWDGARQNGAALWEQLEKGGAAGMEFPVWAYVVCADCFERNGEPECSRAAADAGYRELMRRAEKISDLGWRRSFMENVPEHRAIAGMWHRLSGS